MLSWYSDNLIMNPIDRLLLNVGTQEEAFWIRSVNYSVTSLLWFASREVAARFSPITAHPPLLFRRVAFSYPSELSKCSLSWSRVYCENGTLRDHAIIFITSVFLGVWGLPVWRWCRITGTRIDVQHRRKIISAGNKDVARSMLIKKPTHTSSGEGTGRHY